MIYFTSDTHFGHYNIIRLCNRPFADADEMNEYMLYRWNEKVNENDTIYIIGDLFFKCKNPQNILSQLKGKKHLIIGNHDNSWLRLIMHQNILKA
ncbi:MAG: metallophosphoesterase [Clostridia bacterium]|nr:metallophosphoesterase [Clostridia bacterium]